jgi:type II secretory pathway pseudopilin PulG
MNRRGFTIVELIIVITIMIILLGLGVANLRNSQINGRDAERKTDIENIVLNLETYYESGTDGSTSIGVYPSTTELIGHETTILRDIDMKSLAAPSNSETASSLVVATCTGACVQTTIGVIPSPTINTYVYQPLQSDGTLCNQGVSGSQECRKFNLYYKLEADNTVYMVTSKNQ